MGRMALIAWFTVLFLFLGVMGYALVMINDRLFETQKVVEHHTDRILKLEHALRKMEFSITTKQAELEAEIDRLNAASSR